MQIWDDEYTDANGNVIVGCGRAAAASASKKRKEAEKKAAASQNKGFFDMLANVTSKTDDGDGLSTAVVKK